MDERFMNELLAKRADCTKAIQALVTEAEGKQMDADQSAKFENAMKDFDSIDMQIKALEKTKIVDEFKKIDAKPSDIDGFTNYLRRGDISNVVFKNDMGSGSTSAGALVPTQLYNQIVEKMYKATVMLSLGDVINVSSDTNIPVAATASTAYWGSEAGTYTASDIAFDKLSLTPKKATALIKVSEELLADSAFDVASYVAGNIGTQMGRLLENGFINGTGTTEPFGVAVSASFCNTSSVTNSFNYSDIVTLFSGLGSGYRANGTFLVSDTALKTLMLLTDGASQYIFQPSYNAGVPDMLLGKPLKTSEYMATLTSSAKSVLFGDFSYYKIARRSDMTMQRLVELYAGNGQIGFKVYWRIDGGLALTEAVKYMVAL